MFLKNDPYIIAEIGVNHENSIDNAKLMIDQAKSAGASAVKFQTYKASKLADAASPAYWDTSQEPTETQFALFEKYDRFGAAEFAQLSIYCKEKGIDFISTPFDLEAVDFLDELMDVYKVASSDLTNIPLLRKVGSKNKLVILSTGASTIEEIRLGVTTLSAAGASRICLLHCILNYPTDNSDAHLGMIKGLLREFPSCIIGYSDHTLPQNDLPALQAAWLLGAKVLEKHFTFDKTLPGNDHYHSMDQDDLQNFVLKVEVLRKMIGPSEEKRPLSSEQNARVHARRSIFVNKKVKVGDTISENDLITKRPCHGIPAENWDKVIGKKWVRGLDADQVVNWEDIE